MKKRLSKEEILALATEEDFERPLEEAYEDYDQIIVSKDGELYVVGVDNIENFFTSFDGGIADLEKEFAKQLRKIRQMVLDHAKYYSVAKGMFIGRLDSSGDLSYLYIERKANASEEENWVKEREEEMISIEKHNNEVRERLPKLKNLLIEI